MGQNGAGDVEEGGEDVGGPITALRLRAPEMHQSRLSGLEGRFHLLGHNGRCVV